MTDFDIGFVRGTIMAIVSIDRNLVGASPNTVIREIIGGSSLTLEEIEAVKGDIFEEEYETVLKYMEDKL